LIEINERSRKDTIRKKKSNLMNKAAEGNHSKAAVLDLGELVTLEVLLVGALRYFR
jgi:hypothetical protein